MRFGIFGLVILRPLPAARRAVRSARITPELIWFVASASRRENPYPAYRRLQRLDPLHHSPLGVWVVSNHADVSAVLRNPLFSSDESSVDLATLHVGPLRRLLGREREPDRVSGYFEWLRELMLFRDAPDHTRLRSLVNKAFTPRTVQRLEPRVHALTDDLLDGIVPTGETDLMATFAYPLPARVICELIGVPESDTSHVIEQAPALAAGLDPGPLLTPEARAAANAACEAIIGYINELMAVRRADPQDDLISALLHTDDGLSDSELVAMVALILIAGHETTANLLGNGIVALLSQPEALRELRLDPGLDGAAVDELLRYDSPVQMTIRIASSAVEVGGRPIEPGTILVLCTGAANRDATVFDHPDRLDWHRVNNPHLAFGGGAHFCLGAPLARMETRIALRSVLDRMPDLHLTGTPVRRPSFSIRALSALPLGWTSS
jgi:cytochrome P450